MQVKVKEYFECDITKLPCFLLSKGFKLHEVLEESKLEIYSYNNEKYYYFCISSNLDTRSILGSEENLIQISLEELAEKLNITLKQLIANINNFQIT